MNTPERPDPPVLPLALRVVAVVSIIAGVGCAIELVGSFMQGRVSLNFGVLGIPIGIGLLRLRRGWRTLGLVDLWIGLIGLPVFVLFALPGQGIPTWQLFGVTVSRASHGALAAFGVALWLLHCWAYHVLTRPDVRRLFGQS